MRGWGLGAELGRLGENMPHPEALRSLTPILNVFSFKQNPSAGGISYQPPVWQLDGWELRLVHLSRRSLFCILPGERPMSYFLVMKTLERPSLVLPSLWVRVRVRVLISHLPFFNLNPFFSKSLRTIQWSEK